MNDRELLQEFKENRYLERHGLCGFDKHRHIEGLSSMMSSNSYKKFLAIRAEMTMIINGTILGEIREDFWESHGPILFFESNSYL